MSQLWDDLDGIAPTALVEARLQAHHAVQWLARAACANLAPMPGDTHSNLGWKQEHAAFLSHDLQPAGDERLRVGLAIESLTLIVVNDDTIADQFPLDGKTNAQAGAWLDRFVAAAGLALPSGATLPYAIPAHPVGSGAAYTSAAQHDELTALARWFAAADEILTDIRAGCPAGAASPVRCWPHHFDIATLWTLGDGDAETAPAVGVGLSPGDGAYAEPYFYVSPWPWPAPEKLPPLPAPADWHTKGFTAAILTGTSLVALSDRRETTRQLLAASISTAHYLATPSRGR
jgi:hypothetical protein